jgi:site-specific recombinase XerD
MNQRIAALRGLFEFAVVTGACDRNPSAQRSSGLRAKRRGLLGHVSTGQPRGRGRLVREQRRLPDHHPSITRLDQLDRPVIEGLLVWNHGRSSRGRRAAGRPVSIARQHQAVSTLKTFFEDLALWGWAQRPARPLVHRSDLPRLPEAVPRALSPDGDRDLMTAVDQLDDPAARCAINILRRTDLRLGELLDLELDCVIDYADHGAWLRVPLGKLNNERTVPLDQPTLDAFDDWVSRRGRCRRLIHPRTQRPVEFLFVVNGRRMGAGRIRRALELAAAAAGLGHVPRRMSPLWWKRAPRWLVHAGSCAGMLVHCGQGPGTTANLNRWTKPRSKRPVCELAEGRTDRWSVSRGFS